MCAQYLIMAKRREISERFDIPIEQLRLDAFDLRVLPYRLAPVVVCGVASGSAGNELRSMNFSLIPSWSKERKVKFSTHNARLFSKDEKSGREIPIFEKPTWKAPFLKRHCLVPMTQFIEPIYEGSLAGNMVSFRTQNSALLAAAGIWETWVSKEDGEVIDSFTVLTDDPYPFVANVGHSRSPIFLSSEFQMEWLSVDDRSPKHWIEFLREKREVPEFEVDIDRPLASGKRKST